MTRLLKLSLVVAFVAACAPTHPYAPASGASPGPGADPGPFSVILLIAHADGEQSGRPCRTVDQMVAVLDAGFPRRAISGAQDGLTFVLDQNDLAFKHMDELVFFGMPMALARPGT